MKRLFMQYPYDKKKVKNLDGALHEIEVEKMAKVMINGQEYFYMDYTDFTLRKKHIGTFLKNINGVLCKVTLEDNNPRKIGKYVADCPSELLDEKEIEEMVPAVIGLAETTTIENIVNNGPVDSRNVTVQYPYNSSSEAIDGKIHEVTPLKLVRMNVNGLEYFFMEYFDHSLGHEMFTILYNIDGVLHKVPLTLYSIDEIKTFIGKYGVEAVDPRLVFGDRLAVRPTIPLAVGMGLRDIGASKLEDGKPQIDYPYYIPYNPENPMSISDRIFRSSCRMIGDPKTDFIFEKEKNGNGMETAIREQIRANMDKIERGETFFIEVTVEIPKGTTVEVPTKDERMVKATYIPGVHHHKILLTPCLDKQMDKMTRLCDRLGIQTDTATYSKYDDNARVFQGGYESKLPTTFYGLPDTKEAVLHETETKKKEEVKTAPVVPPVVPPKKDEPVVPPKKDEPVDSREELLSLPAISYLTNLYLNNLQRVMSLNDGVAINDQYVASYRDRLRLLLVKELSKLGIAKEDMDYIIASVDARIAPKTEEGGKRLIK